jgi:hypothetical protein
MNVVIDGELFDPYGLGFTYTLATGDTESVDVCLPGGVLGGTSCVQITVSCPNPPVWGCYDSEISWDISIGGLPIVAGGAPFEGGISIIVTSSIIHTIERLFRYCFFSNFNSFGLLGRWMERKCNECCYRW